MRPHGTADGSASLRSDPGAAFLARLGRAGRLSDAGGEGGFFHRM